MKVDRTPFTTFDFIGYFIPGFIFLYLLYLTFRIDFVCILQIEEHSKFHYEHIIFSLFILIFSWFVGHLLSWLSHLFQKRAEKIFDNDISDCHHLLDLFCQGKRKLLPRAKKEYQNLLEDIFKKLVNVKDIPEIICQNEGKALFLKSMSYYIDPNKFSIIYNYLVIQGAFRAFTFSFVLHSLIICTAKINNFGLEEWANVNFWYILAFDGGTSFICWNIYLKYYRRQIEENVVFLIHKLYGIYGENEENNKRSKK